MSKKTFILSTGGMTTKRIVVPVNSINFDAFDNNPVMLFNHKRGEVIGNWENRRVENGKLLAEPVFDDEDPDAKKIAGKVERGFIKAASIGIRNIVAEERSDDAGEKYFHVLSCELREASIVDVPSDADALVFYDEKDQVIDLKEANFSDHFQIKTFVKQMDKKKIAQIIGLSDDASDEAIELAVKGAFDDQKKLRDQEAARKLQQKNKAVELVDAAVSAGKLNKDLKANYLELADANYDLFEKTINGLPEPVRLSQVGKTTPTGVANDRKDWTFTDWQKKDSKGLEKMDEADRQKLYDAEFGD